MAQDKFIGHLAAGGAYVIFGLNIVFCKDIANSNLVPPIVLFTMRAIGAAALFWLISLFMPREKVRKEDFPAIAVASAVGLFLPQLAFLSAIARTTTIDVSILSTLSPIFTMFIAAVALKEPITLKKASGVIISFCGVLMLIFNSVHAQNGVDTSSAGGVALMLLNGLSFAAYLGVFRPLISRYSVVTFMKWMFLFSLLMSLPFSLGGFFRVDYAAIGGKVAAEIGFLIFFATFVAYFLIPVGQKHIRPTLVSMYSYLQPIIAVVVAIAIGMDFLTWQKVIATALVFAGVLLVTKSRAGSVK